MDSIPLARSRPGQGTDDFFNAAGANAKLLVGAQTSAQRPPAHLLQRVMEVAPPFLRSVQISRVESRHSSRKWVMWGKPFQLTRVLSGIDPLSQSPKIRFVRFSSSRRKGRVALQGGLVTCLPVWEVVASVRLRHIDFYPDLWPHVQGSRGDNLQLLTGMFQNR